MSPAFDEKSLLTTTRLDVSLTIVSKAMNELERATDERAERYANERICLFTQQLDVSNPVLTQISDAMTAEADGT